MVFTCKEFFRNPTINPYTGTKLSAQEYNDLTRKCGILERNYVTTLSGVSTWYCFDYMGRRYNLFGDIHMSREVNKRTYNCESTGQLCTQLGLDLHPVYPSRKCWSFPAYLDAWLEYNKKHNIVTDVHVEYFYGKNGPPEWISYSTLDMKNIKWRRDELTNEEYAILVGFVLLSCLRRDKKYCKYGPTVRVHYSDGRLEINKPIKSNFSYILSLFGLRKYLDILLENLSDNYEESIDDIDDIYDVMNFTLKTASRIFLLLCDEHNFIINFNEIINDLHKISPSIYRDMLEDELLIILENSSIRDDKRMYKLAIQLRALRLEGKGNIADLLIKYFINYLQVLVINAEAGLNNWYSKIFTVESERDKQDVIYELLDSSYMLEAFLGDPYFLARMFRFSDSKQVIGIAHERHVNVWIGFFTHYLKIKPIVSIPSKTVWNTNGPVNSYTRCISNDKLSLYTYPQEVDPID